MVRRNLRVGIFGGGMGGLAAAIAIARGGAEVTVLEAAHELGEIGASIQGVDKIIGSNLVAHEECNTYYGKDTELIAYSDPKAMVKNTGFPWWVVRRDHLHAGLVESAKQHGVKFIVDRRVSKVDDSEEMVHLETTTGETYDFDLVIGADGIRSYVRQTLFLSIVPKAPSKMAAYRGVLPYSKIFAAVPEARQYLRNTMDVYAGPQGFKALF